MKIRPFAAACGALLAPLAGCLAPTYPGQLLPRTGDEIVVAGQLFHTGTRVVLWLDQHGYDAYRVEPRFVDPPPASAPAAAAGPASDSAAPEPPTSPTDSSASAPAAAPATQSQPASRPRPARKTPEGARYGSFRKHLPPPVLAEVMRDGWSLPQLQEHVDLFVLHYDVCGTSRQCFKVLQDIRGLSVQFMLDVDGTIYQTLDLKERAWHAGHANDRSIGIEIANIGAYPLQLGAAAPQLIEELATIHQPVALSDLRHGGLQLPPTLDQWYDVDPRGRPRVVFPGWMKVTGIRSADFIARPARRSPIIGRIHGQLLAQYDFTDEQYRALARLTATLCTVLPRIELEFPRDPNGRVAQRELTPAEFENFHGVLGHFHLTRSKQDPGPALDWERLRRMAQGQMRSR